MAKKVHKGINKLLAFFLSVLGIGGACTMNSCMYGSPAVEYGTPHATFIVNGNVSNEQSEVIEGIQVVLQDDTTFTDVDGNYSAQIHTWVQSEFPLEFSDIDGDKNGSYQNVDTIFHNDSIADWEWIGAWEIAEVKKEINIILKKKDE